jgi:anthranilate synthase component I
MTVHAIAPPGTLGAVTPSREEFRALAVGHRVIPVTRRLLADDETPVGVYRKLAGDRPGTFLFESAENGRSWSRWSFVGARSAAAMTVVDGRLTWTGEVPAGLPTSGDPLSALRTVVEELHSEPLPGLPPLTGGMVGYLGYDIVRRLEKLPLLTEDDLRIPELVMLLATDLAAVDHHEGTITLIANAINWDASDERVDEAYDDAVARLDRMTEDLAAPAASTVAVYSPAEPRFTRRRSPAEHHAAVEIAKEQIRAGEAFQVVVSQRFETACDADPLDVYRVLRATNPSPYMYLLRLESAAGERFEIVGSSPEALVTVLDGVVTTHPIAGTRWRGATEEEDQLLRRTSAPTRRSAPSTSCSSTSGATTSAASASPARSRCAASSRWSATATSCTSSRR